MNRRILKKRCKHAMQVLIREHGYRLDQFAPSNGEETIDLPHGFDKRDRAAYRTEFGGWLEPGPLKGTPLLWEHHHTEDADEWDCKLPSEVLQDLIGWSFFVYRPEDWEREPAPAAVECAEVAL